MKTLRYLKTLLKMNFRELGAFRLSALLQILFMLINNLVFFVFWIIVYANIETIRGVGIAEVAFLFGSATTAFGIAVAVAGGSLRLAELVSEGKLDIYLTQPQDVLLQALSSRTNLTGWGDFLSGLILVGYYWGMNPKAWGVLLVASFCGALLILGTLTIYQCLIFWIPRSERLSDQLNEFFITFMLYPNSLFSGPVRGLTYTLIPAAYINFLPTLVLQGASGLFLFMSLLAAGGYWILARKIFFMGLRRYESGSQFIHIR